MNSSASWLTVAAAIFAVRFVAGEAFFERSTVKKGKIVFPPVLGIRILFGIGTPGGFFVASRIAETEGLSQNWFLVLFCVTLSIASFVLMPGTLIVSAQGLRQRKWFGLLSTVISWSDVDYVFSSSAERLLTVVSKDGTEIKHTQYHVDPDAFKEALKKYCKKYYRDDRQL